MTLLKNTKVISISEKFLNAVSKNHVEQTYEILQFFGEELSAEVINISFMQAVRKKHVEIIPAILKFSNDKLSSSTVSFYFVDEARHSARQMFIPMLKFVGKHITENAINRAFIEVASQGHEKNLLAILEYADDRITSDSIEQVFLNLARLGNQKGISALLEFVGDRITDNILNEGFKYAASGYKNKEAARVIAEFTDGKVLRESLSDKFQFIIDESVHHGDIFKVWDTLDSQTKTKISGAATSEDLKFISEYGPAAMISEIFKLNPDQISVKLAQYPEFEVREYHNVIDSLLAQDIPDSILSTRILENKYMTLLKIPHSIVSDILYTTSINQNAQRQFTFSPIGKYGHVGGHYRPYGDISTIETAKKHNISDVGALLHEELHRVTYYAAGDSEYVVPYGTEAEKLLFIKAVKKTLFNIGDQFYKITISPHIMDKTTWEIGKELRSLARESNKAISRPAVYHISEVSKYDHLAYNEHGEFLPRLPQIILDPRFNEQDKKIIAPLFEYYNEIMVPKIEDYLLRYDHSKFCANHELLPDFIV